MCRRFDSSRGHGKLKKDLETTDFGAALTEAPVSRRVGVQVVVRGRIGTTADTGDVTLPAVPLELPIVPIPLPSVAALFRDTNLAGDAVLVMVPAKSPFSSADQLLGVLAPLRNLLQTVDTAATVAAWATGTRGLLSAVDAISTRLPLTKHVGFKALDEHSDLGKYNFIVLNNWPDTDIEDRGSSCLLVSTSRTISFFQHDDFGGKELILNALPQFPPASAVLPSAPSTSSSPNPNPPAASPPAR